MALRLLSLSDVSRHTAISYETLKSWRSRGKLPEPDVIIGLGDGKAQTQGWSETTIDEWIRTRQPE